MFAILTFLLAALALAKVYNKAELEAIVKAEKNAIGNYLFVLKTGATLSTEVSTGKRRNAHYFDIESISGNDCLRSVLKHRSTSILSNVASPCGCPSGRDTIRLFLAMARAAESNAAQLSDISTFDVDVNGRKVPVKSKVLKMFQNKQINLDYSYYTVDAEINFRYSTADLSQIRSAVTYFTTVSIREFTSLATVEDPALEAEKLASPTKNLYEYLNGLFTDNDKPNDAVFNRIMATFFGQTSNVLTGNAKRHFDALSALRYMTMDL